VHLRLDIPLARSGEPLRAFMTDAAALVASHGGSLSGEHGDGRARSELLPVMYSPQAIELFGAFKALLDPRDLLNPGVLVAPRPLDADLRRPHARPVLAAGGFAFAHDHGDFTTAVHRCTGVGKCRADNTASGGFMCPSYLATRDEKDSTRGRARVLQEMINGGFVTGGFASPEVHDVLDLCLSCKACSSDCPAGVDMAAYKSEVLYRTYRRKLRPVSHYALGWLPRWARAITAVPGGGPLVNAVLSSAPLRKVVLAAGGMDARRGVPAFARRPFRAWARGAGLVGGSVGAGSGVGAGQPSAPTASALPPAPAMPGADARPLGDEVTVGGGGAVEGRDLGVGASAVGGAAGAAARAEKLVVLWADSFSDSLAPGVGRAAVAVLEDAGYRVIVPDGQACCGLTWITTGQLDGARKRLSQLLSVLGPFAVNGVPIVGLEPSCTAVLRSDLLELFPDDPRARAVAGATHTMAELLTAPEPVGPGDAWSVPDLTGVTAVVQPHCHHYSVMGFRADEKLLRAAGADLQVAAGCCGLAGNWGMEKGHYETSVAVAENSLLPALRDLPSRPGDEHVLLADGFSCRTQAGDLAGVDGIALAELLAAHLHRAPRVS